MIKITIKMGLKCNRDTARGGIGESGQWEGKWREYCDVRQIKVRY
jgi:hypothetical protein